MFFELFIDEIFEKTFVIFIFNQSLGWRGTGEDCVIVNTGNDDINYQGLGRRGEWNDVPCSGIDGTGHGSICEAGMHQKLLHFVWQYRL